MSGWRGGAGLLGSRRRYRLRRPYAGLPRSKRRHHRVSIRRYCGMDNLAPRVVTERDRSDADKQASGRIKTARIVAAAPGWTQSDRINAGGTLGHHPVQHDLAGRAGQTRARKRHGASHRAARFRGVWCCLGEMTIARLRKGREDSGPSRRRQRNRCRIGERPEGTARHMYASFAGRTDVRTAGRRRAR